MKGLTSTLSMTCYHGTLLVAIMERSFVITFSLPEKVRKDDSATGELTDMVDKLSMAHMKIQGLANSSLH